MIDSGVRFFLIAQAFSTILNIVVSLPCTFAAIRAKKYSRNILKKSYNNLPCCMQSFAAKLLPGSPKIFITFPGFIGIKKIKIWVVEVAEPLKTGHPADVRAMAVVQVADATE